LLDDSLADCQSDTASGIFGLGVETFEESEDLLEIFGLNTDAVVGDGNDGFLILLEDPKILSSSSMDSSLEAFSYNPTEIASCHY